ncbi:MAG TPA: hypothetical protein VMG12_23010 [Polyangiaceae bacterium]|nr:hypothetical protein [Polyangiaceae bacterium]
MSSVVGFWQMLEEEPGFLDYLRKTGPLVGVPHGVVRDEAELQPRPLDALLTTSHRVVLLTPERFSDGIVRWQGPHEGAMAYSANLMSSSVLAYERPRLVGPRKLGMCNLSAYPSFLDDAGNQVEKPVEFVKWYKKVMKHARDITPQWHRFKTYRITERVAQAVGEGWELVP